MNGRRTGAVMVRVIRQFRRDPRTLALVIVVPLFVTLLVGYLLQESNSQASIVVVTGATGQPSVADVLADRLESAGFKVERACCQDQALSQVKSGHRDAALVVNAGTDGSGGSLQLTLEGTNPTSTRAMLKVAEQLAGSLPPGALATGDGLSSALAGSTPLDVTYLHGGPQFGSVDFQAPAFIGFFAFFFVFVLTTVSFLRERTVGTLERLMVTPVSRVEIVLGYMLGFGVVALVQSVVILGASVLVLRIHYEGNLGLVFLLVGALTVASVNLGIFLSTFARTELQAVQFIPVVLVPQGLLCGLLWPIASLPRWLQGVARIMPLTYSTDALRGVMLRGESFGNGGFVLDFVVLLAFAALFVVLAAGTLRRRLA